MDAFIESLDLTGFKRAPVDEAVALIYELLYQDGEESNEICEEE